MPRPRKTPEQVKALDLATAENPYETFAIAYDEGFKAIASPLEDFQGVSRANRMDRMGFNPNDIGGPGISGRYGMTNKDYEAWRPHEVSSYGTNRQTMIASDLAYKRHGLIRNMIDLMGDFGSQGIRVVHPNPTIQRFYQNWFKRVKGKERSERFLNHLYRLGNVAIRMQSARITKTVRDEMYTSQAAADFQPTVKRVPKNEIPWKYTFLHPATLQVMGGELSNFVETPQYAIQITRRLAKMINKPEKATQLEQDIINSLPADLKQAVKTNQPVLLPVEKTFVFHYKKDDWQEWADPIIGSILLDISLYEKLKLADRVALDGAIANVRIFKIGNLEYKIAPTAEAAQRLAEILAAVGSGGSCDLIWGPDLELLETKTDIHNFLGISKYEPTLMAIYAGLGIPPTLTGTFGASGTTNNFVSLKTLVQRLEYGRDVLNEFWSEQIEIVQKAMGFKLPATIEFDLMNLGDDVAERALLLQLADRNLISDELLQRYIFGGNSDMEAVRLMREHKERMKEKRVPKAGPWHNPDPEQDYKKIFAQRGVITPGELGIELEERKEGEITPLEVQKEGQEQQQQVQLKKAGQPQQGRPKNSSDTKQRQRRTFKPKAKAMELWADSAQDEIAEHLNPVILAQYGKKTMRQLTSAESEEAESYKFGVLCNLEPYKEITQQSIAAALNAPFKDEVFEDYNSYASEVIEAVGRKLTVDDRKHIQSQIYANMELENNG